MTTPQQFDFANTPISPQRPHLQYAPQDVSAPPSVSIVTPFYNTGPVFHETAHSVLGQSFQQWEWLIVNDKSTDPESLAILEDYARRDPRIRLIQHDTNQGISAARNTGFRAARTPYIVQLDSDDLLETTAVEKWFWFLESFHEYSFTKGYSVGFGAQEYLWDKGFHLGKAFLQDNAVDPTSMIRKSVFNAVGGYDESNRNGLEDWEFWLHCADLGYWGATIPEYLNWYRRRPSHDERWSNWDHGAGQEAFRVRMHERYPRLWNGGFPQIQPRWHMPNDDVRDTLPTANRLRKTKPRLLMIVPWLTIGGADQFNLNLLPQLTAHGWEVSIATTVTGDHSRLPEFSRHTPDIFVLHHFLRLVDYPRFLRYLICSRQVDAVLISNSELGYLLLPYLRAHCPDVTFLDYTHIEEENWKNGGYPRMAVEFQESIDLSIVASEHLKQWMLQRGAEAERVKVCRIHVDTDLWQPDASKRAAVRRELGCKDQVPLILYAGRICQQKQPRVFAQTLLRLKAENVKFVALVAGDGPDWKWLKTFVEDHRLRDQVYLCGAISNENVRRLMTAADIFFLPSEREGIALSVYEAMSCGLAVVGADVGGQRELVTPETGVLIARSNEENEAKQYALVLADLIRDPERRTRLGQAARSRVDKDFRLDQMGKKMVALLEEAMERHASHPRPIVSVGLGRASAAQAVEYTRLFRVAEQLWAERNGNGAVQNVNGGNQHYLLHSEVVPEHWRFRLYLTLNRWHEPYYRWYTQRGWNWLTPVRQRVKDLLLAKT